MPSNDPHFPSPLPALDVVGQIVTAAQSLTRALGRDEQTRARIASVLGCGQVDHLARLLVATGDVAGAVELVTACAADDMSLDVHVGVDPADYVREQLGSPVRP